MAKLPRIGKSVGDAAKAAGDKASAAGRKIADGAGDFSGPSPNPHTNLAIADIALRGSALIARRAVERTLLGGKFAPKKAKAILKGRTMGEVMLHSALSRIALRSVPGAIIVGGGLLAKTLYDRTKSHQARAAGEAKLQDMAETGSEE